jgi:hypothetical protein
LSTNEYPMRLDLALHICARLASRRRSVSRAKHERGHAASMTCRTRSDTPKHMENAGLSRPWPRNLAMLALLLGAMNCENGSDSKQTPAPSALVPAPMEMPTAQPPKLADQPVMPPPSLSPTPPIVADSAGASAKTAPPATSLSPTAPATPAKTNPKATADAPGIRETRTSPGPMAPRTADTM